MGVRTRPSLVYWRVATVAAAIGLAAASLNCRPDESVLGTGKGVDHVGIAVRDLDQARERFQGFGFDVSCGGRLADDGQNAIVRFSDYSYLELITSDRSSKQETEVARFLQQHEGPYVLGVETSSAQATVDILRRRGLKPLGPKTNSITWPGETEASPPRWHYVVLEQPPFPDDSFFFIQYTTTPEARRRVDGCRTEHDNTAIRLRAAWYAVSDLATATKTAEGLGFTATRRVTWKKLDAEAQEVMAGGGSILLLRGNTPASPVSQFLAQRGEGLFGATVEVSDIARAPKSASQFDGFFGDSVLLPPAETYHTLIELVHTPTR